MLQFEIVPIDPAVPPIRIQTSDAGDALILISRQGCSEADVYNDGVYMFTALRDVNGLWKIYQRERDPKVGDFG